MEEGSGPQCEDIIQKCCRIHIANSSPEEIRPLLQLLAELCFVENEVQDPKIFKVWEYIIFLSAHCYLRITVLSRPC